MFRSALVIALLSISSICNAMQILCEVEVAGKIFDRDGNLITDEVTLSAELRSWTYPDSVKSNFIKEIITDTQTIEKKVYGGAFSWKLPDANTCEITAFREGYNGDRISINDKDGKIIAKDVMFHLIKQGVPSKLEYTNDAQIPSTDNKKSSGKQCGWSFSKRWYYPVDGDVPVDIVLSIDENNQRTYAMREPGGFVYCPGLPAFESRPNELDNCFEWMPEAPEDGYVQTVCPAEKEENEMGGIYYYFKTPDGKYGKICFRGDFDYYINPDGSRNLEAGEVEEWDPIHPGYREWEEQWSR
jgi:hypothetical protein